MHRFFVPPDWISDQRARLEGGTAHQIVRVLRMSPGDEILLLDNSGQEYQVGITRLAKDVVEGNVLAVRQGQGEPGTEITLYQAVLKGSKFDLVLQKGTELGVEVHPSQVRTWRRALIEGAGGIFGADQDGDRKAEEALIAQLYQHIGQLKVERDFLNGKLGA